MRITRVIGSLQEPCMETGCFIEASVRPDEVLIQNEGRPLSFGGEGKTVLAQKGWSLSPKDIYRYSIEGKAQVVTKRTVDGERTFVENAKDILIGRAYEGKLVFSIGENERILGLGQHEDGAPSYRGCTQHLYQNNMQIPMPVFVSSGGYAVLVDACCLMVYEEYGNEITLTLDAVSQIDYYVIEGGSFRELLKGIRRLTGKAPLLPRWAYGYVQSKERYKDQEEIGRVAEEFARRGIPVSCLVLDWMSWEEGKWGNKYLDKARFPHLSSMTEQLHRQGVGFMVSVWPNMNQGCEDNQEMLDAGKLYANLSTYDAFDREARELYWKQCNREIFSGGTDAWWCDSTEPFTPDWNGSEKKTAQERYELAKESLAKYMDARQANAFALYHAKGIHDNQRKTDASKRVVNLTRSGYPSIQKYGTILWSGDIMATWETMKHQIVEGIHMCSSGIPYWTLDIGAFFTGNLNAWKKWSGAKEGTQPWFWNGDFEEGTADKGYCELYVRWLQYGTFLPVMRSHGTDTPREPWNFGEPGTVYYDTIVKYIRLRYRLTPYIYSLAYGVYEEDDTMMQGLLLAYPEDGKAAEAEDEFLFGDFLVCPVTFPVEYGPESVPVEREAQRGVYLPQGDDWFDYESHDWYPGGTQLMAQAPVERMPLYLRSGSILPVNPREEENLYARPEPEEITVEIYGGRDGSFLYYLDQGNGYEYQDGEYVKIPLKWEEEDKAFTIGAAQGSYAYPKDWTVRLIGRDGREQSKRTEYRGEEVRVIIL